MPTAESIFPKSGGDPLYASEVNWFNRGVFQYTNVLGSVVSGTDLVTVGSMVIPAGSLTNPCNFKVLTRGNNANMGTLSQLGVAFSGTSAGRYLISGAAGDDSAQATYIFQGIIGSFNIAVGSDAVGFVRSLPDGPNERFTMDPSLGFVVLYQLRHDNSSSVGQSLALSSFEAVNLGSVL